MSNRAASIDLTLSYFDRLSMTITIVRSFQIVVVNVNAWPRIHIHPHTALK